jgi:cytochrome c biogenesis protein CcdA
MIDPGPVALGALAGVLSVLSPCVLPLLPLVLGAAATAHRWGVVALAAGLAVSFTLFGLAIATIGPALGLGLDTVQDLSAALLILFGVVLLSETLQHRFTLVTARLGSAGHAMAAKVGGDGVGQQLLLGVLLGAAWSPCVGPTLGAASLLAAQGRALPQVAAVMLAFGLGAGLPLLVLGRVSRPVMLRVRGRLLRAGQTGRRALGLLIMAVGLMILSGADHWVETALVNVTPAWLSDLTTRY